MVFGFLFLISVRSISLYFLFSSSLLRCLPFLLSCSISHLTLLAFSAATPRLLSLLASISTIFVAFSLVRLSLMSSCPLSLFLFDGLSLLVWVDLFCCFF